MSEERRAAPGPNTAEVGAALPDLDGGESGPRPQASGTRDGAAARRRGRMTLRIPDDEVTRPQGEVVETPQIRALARPVPTPVPVEAPPPDSQAGPLTPMRIISITSDLPPAPQEEPDGPEVVASQQSWAPDATSGVELTPGGDVVDADVSSEMPTFDDAGDDVEVVAHIQIDGAISESLPPLAAVEPEPEPATEPVLPAAPSTPQRAADADFEDVRFDEDVPTPALPRVEASNLDVTVPADGERRSDPGEAPEISAEDLVAVESAPVARVPVELPPMRARMPSQPPVPPPAARPASLPIRPPLVIVPPHAAGVGLQAPETMGPRRKGRLWWEDLFNDDYLRTMEKVTDAQIAREADFIEASLGLERGGAMLDLACGTGRQAIELARRGYEVVAFDLSLAMLARAGDEAQEREAKLNFVQGDMREMTFDEQFDGVYCWNTSFGYFDEEKNAHVIDRVHRSLKAGGLFLLDVVNRDFIIRQSPSLAWFEGDGCVCMDEMTVDFITSRMKIKRTLMLDDGRSREIEYSMRVYGLHELGKILHEHGFKVCEVSGRTATPGVFFGNESPRTIILAEKR